MIGSDILLTMESSNETRVQDYGTTFLQVYLCTRQGCEARLTLPVNDSAIQQRCPVCRAELQPEGLPYPRLTVTPASEKPGNLQLEVLLDNIRSAWNVGSMLRTCDGAGVRRVHLCGVTALPDNSKVIKTALGAEKNLPWSFHHNALTAVRQLKDQGVRIWTLEGGPRAVPLFEAQAEITGDPMVLVVGNEVSGVDPGIMDLCDRVVSLPMQGVKGSLNVAVAFGIAVYFLRFATKASGGAANERHEH